ncbi:hypothetical protein [Ruegeria sp. SCP11]|uniref:hypothetical protein n=1 Tax=Ruegeria sp. SCP11 TaxID=3141378 RepID=UPI00333815EF
MTGERKLTYISDDDTVQSEGAGVQDLVTLANDFVQPALVSSTSGETMETSRCATCPMVSLLCTLSVRGPQGP